MKITRHKIVVWVIFIALAASFLGIVRMLSWAFQPDNILEIHNAPFPVRTVRPHATADGVIILKVDYCKTRSIKGTTRTSFVSKSREVLLPLQDENGPKTCQNIEVPILIPKDLTADTYKVKFRVTYNLNPLKKNIVKEFESQEFIVDPIPEPPKAEPQAGANPQSSPVPTNQSTSQNTTSRSQTNTPSNTNNQKSGSGQGNQGNSSNNSNGGNSEDHRNNLQKAGDSVIDLFCGLPVIKMSCDL